MARPKNDDRRSAILAAAARVIAVQGLAAPTALIAKEASVSNGSLFTYFETKADLLNALYLALKSEMALASLDGIPAKSSIRKQSQYMWSHWLAWATSAPEKRRALAYLTVSNEITAESQQKGHQLMSGVAALLERARENGPMRNVPLGFVVALMNATADTTIDFITQDRANADKHSATAFEALWRMIG
jgi:AcrR family transcriptional regulator